MNQSLADELVMMLIEDQRLLQRLFDSGELGVNSRNGKNRTLNLARRP
ncbi:hypothetical protein MLC59_12850 [Marinobacter bryozoorum]|jgi:hypothetical protein|nr:hypothetical protein [Marinobacter bryozoorum]MCK7545050.1 hypothetical protein [Marinobacter bryozoorum]